MEMYKYIFIFLFVFIFINADYPDKKPVTVTGDNAKSRLVTDGKGEKTYVTELTGHPAIKSDGRELRTDKIIIRGNNGEIAEAIGNVVLNDKTNGSKIIAAQAVFFKEKNIIEFYGRPSAQLKRGDDKSFVNIKADTMKYDLNSNTAEAEGKVHLINNETIIKSNKAVFSRDSKTAVFSKNPEIKNGNDIFKAEEIIYYTDKKNIILNKNAFIKAYSEEKDPKTNVIKKVLINAGGDRIEHNPGKEKYTIVQGNAIIIREDSVTTGDRLEMKGEKGKEDLNGSNIHIKYKTENVEAFGKNFKSNRREGNTVLWGNACILINDSKTGSETSRIFGDYLEHYRDIDELYISGNVRIISKDGTIKGDIAKYLRKNNYLIVTGNARIVKDNSTVLASAITIDTKTNNTKLIGDIRGGNKR